MANVVKHGWTHRPRSQGGTDPLPPLELPWALVTSGSQSVTGSNKVVAWSDFFTNADDVFDWDGGSDPEGVQVLKGGLFFAWVLIPASGAAATQRFTLIRSKRLTAGTIGSFSTPYFESTLLDDTNAHASYMGIGSLPTLSSDPFRVEAVAVRVLANYTTDSCSMVVVRIGGLGNI